jgi:hypothetical protein
VRIQQFQAGHDAKAEEAMIHTGPFADEMARSMNALAITIASDIYFRSNAYRPETEEGRKVLAHELTHVNQYAEGRITRGASKMELEEEAAGAEYREEYNGDPLVTVEAGGRRFRLRRSRMRRIAQRVAENLKLWIEQKKAVLPGKEYLDC